MDGYIQEGLEQGCKIRREDIWRAALYTNAREFQKWQSCHKKSSPGTHAKFVRLLTVTKPNLK